MTLVSGIRRPLEIARLLRLLIVDDEVGEIRLMRESLAADGRFRVSTARSASEAESALAAGVDAALISAPLWVGEGGGGLSRLEDAYPEIAFLVLTGGQHECGNSPLPAGRFAVLDRADAQDPAALAARVMAALDTVRSARRRDTMVRWLEREARIDHLSGLYNRRAFDEHLRDLCRTARAEGESVGLILVDVVGTRLVNEAHGRDAGDAVIRRAASGIAESVRGADFAARIGGDDFGIILPQGDMDLARRIARRISHRLEALNAREPQELPVEVMFGVASGRGASAEELFAAADAELNACRRTWPSLRLFPIPEDSGPSVA